MLTNQYNPDILTCLANLSSDEVFTPPSLANDMLDLLPAELWSDKNAKFLDPFTKSGVFLREIAKRLIKGLEKEFPDLQQRLDHIFHNQIYGIAITELTGLLARRSVYCSKFANGKYSVTQFDNEQGNILFERVEHTWKNGKCTFCGASEGEYSRDQERETHAYQFIHTEEPEEIFNMKFDVIIGNPPYQLSDGGHSRSASPVYQKFVQQAKKMNPRFLAMVVPARWFAGGKGLDDFRSEMLSDNRIRKLVDFESASEVFPGVDIAGGICYFIWERDSPGLCEVTSETGGKRIKSVRSLDEFPTFIRSSEALPIIRKVLNKEQSRKRLSETVSPSKPFGMRTFYEPKQIGIPCWFIQRIGLQFAHSDDVRDDYALLDKWKLLLPAAPIAGQTDFSKPVGFYSDGNTVIAKPGECCTESWIVAGAFATKKEVISFRSYIFTKIVRFLLLQAVISQHVTRKNFYFVPDLELYSTDYTDEILINRWGINEEEWQYINSKIR